MKNQQWQLGPETLIVSRNKKEGKGERLQGKLSLVIKQLVNLQVKRNYKNKSSRETSKDACSSSRSQKGHKSASTLRMGAGGRGRYYIVLC